MPGIVALGVFLVACGDPETPPDDPDGGPDGGDAQTPIEAPDLPAAPAPPDLGECPQGFAVETTDRGLRSCRPHGGSTPPSCEGATMAAPSDGSCVPVGLCPDDRFPPSRPGESALRRVDPASTADDPNGSSARPYRTIMEALAGAAPGDVIGLARGTYREEVRIDRSVTVRGVCTGEVVLEAPEGAIAAIGASRAVTIENLSFDGEAPAITSSATLTVSQVVVEDAVGSAISVVGATATLRDVVVRRVRAQSPSVAGGIVAGYSTRTGEPATLEVTHADLGGIDGLSLGAFGPGTLVRGVDVRVASTGDASYAPASASAREGARLELDASFVRGVGVGVLAITEGTAHVTRSLVEGALPGVVAEDDGAVELEQCVIDRCLHNGILIDRGSVVGSDLVVRRTVEVIDDVVQSGLGVVAIDGVATLERAVIEENTGTAVGVRGDDASLHGTDLVVRRTMSDHFDQDGRGVQADTGADVFLTRALFDGNRYVGVSINGSPAGETPTEAHLVDVTVRGTQVEEDTGTFGVGLGAWNGASIVGERVLLEANQSAGFSVRNLDTTADVESLTIRLSSGNGEGIFGRGLEVSNGAVAAVRRAVVESNREFGLLVQDRAELTASDIRVVATTPRTCASDGCAPLFGIGVGVYFDARATLDGFDIGESSLCGVHLASAGAITADHGVMHDNTIAVCVPDASYARSIGDSIRYVDNTTELDVAELPIPEVAASFDDLETP